MKRFIHKLDLLVVIGITGSLFFSSLFGEETKSQSEQENSVSLSTSSSLVADPTATIPSSSTTTTTSSASSSDSTSMAFSDLTCCPSKVKPHKINFRHSQGDGIGYKNGYTTSEVFISNIFDDQLIYFDGRGHFLNQGRWAFSAGGGYRGVYQPWDTVYGANLFLDYRETSHKDFYQMTIGLESLGKTFNLRANGYLPLGKAKKTTGISFGKFSGHHAFFRTDVQQAMWGFDGEIEGKCYSYKKMDLDLSLKGYLFRGTQDRFTIGAQASAALIFYDSFYLKGSASYDRLFHFNGQGEVGLTLSFANPFTSKGSEKKNGCPSQICLKKDLAARMTALPARQDLIVVSKAHGSKIIRDPSGVPCFFYHVDNTSIESLGTAERPFQTLAEAQTASVNGQPIYVHYGSGTTVGMDLGITLKEDQRLLGSGVGHMIATQFGMMEMTAQTPGQNPSLTNTSVNPVVTVANGSEVSGFQIVGTGAAPGTAVQGLNLTRGVKISHNQMFNNGGQNVLDSLKSTIFISIPDSVTMGGTLLITDNEISSYQAGSFGIIIRAPQNGPTGLDVKINNNELVNLLQSPIFIRRQDQAAPPIIVNGEFTLTGEISHNTMASSVGTGIHFAPNKSFGSINLNLRVEDNIMVTDDFGIIFERAAGSLFINNNTIFNNRNAAIHIGYLGTVVPSPLPEDRLIMDIMGNALYDNTPTSGTNLSGLVVRCDKGNIYLRLIDNSCIRDTGPDQYNLINTTALISNFQVELKNNTGVIQAPFVQLVP